MIGYQDVLSYLDAIAAGAAMNVSPHGYWWKTDPNDRTSANISYSAFKTTVLTGDLLGVGGPDVAVMNTDHPVLSPFFQILLHAISSFYPQMPSTQGAPKITDNNGTVQFRLRNGNMISGSQIQANVTEWLINGFPQ